MKSKAWLVMAGACALLANSKAAAQVTFTRIVDTDTYAPGTGETFSGFAHVSLRNDTVMFRGTTFSNHQGIYLVCNGVLEVVLERGMVLPGIGGITGLANPSFDGIGVAIDTDSYSGFHGILLCTDDEVQVVAQRGDPIPDSEHEFETLGCPSVHNGQIAFQGRAPDPAQNGFGIYFWDGDDLSTIVDQDTPVPGDGGAFLGFHEVQHANGDIAFQAPYEAEDAEWEYGVYSTLGGLHVVADTTMEMPGGTGPFIGFTGWPSFDGERVAFVGSDVNGYYAVFVATDDGLEFIADDAGWCLIDAGSVVYYTFSGDTCIKYGSIHWTISPGDILDGQEVLGTGFWKEGLNGTRLALVVVFAEGGVAIYVVDFSGLCPGDLDFDADVDLSDLAIFLAHYGECSGDPDYWIFADIDRRGCVGLEDLATLLSNYGTASGMTPEDGDFDLDGDVDLADLAILLAAYGTTCE